MRAVTCRLVISGLGLAVAWPAAAGAFQIEWAPELDRRGQARIAGHVRNDDLKTADRLRLRVERLGPDGRVTGTYRTWVPGVLASGDRAYFEVGVPEAHAAYRVTVESFDWYRCGE
jgi:hypothetical protein